MSDRNYLSLGCQNQNHEFDVFARIRGEQQLTNVNIVLMPQLSVNTAQKIIAEMVHEGLLAEHLENGEKLYSLTEKGEQIAGEAKRHLLEGTDG